MEASEREKKISAVTLWGALLNVILIVLKIGSGLIIRSYSLIADGVHSFSDLATDFAVLAGSRISSRPADRTHPFGHRKFETIVAFFIGIFLMAVSFGFIWSAARAFFENKVNYPGFMVLIVAGISVAGKEILFFFTLKISRQTGSTSLYANAWHHRSDSFSSMAVLLGGIASLFGWGHGDHLAAIIVGIMIMAVAGKIVYEGLIELSEHSADEDSIRRIERILSKEEGITSFHALRTRKLGGELFVDVHVRVDPSMSVKKSHEITLKIEKKIRKELPNPLNILIHVDPA